MDSWFKLEANSLNTSNLDDDDELLSAAIYCPKGSATLSETALGTLRHIHFYLDGAGAVALLSDTVGVQMYAAPLPELMEKVRRYAGLVLASPSDYDPCTMDDDCGMLYMQYAVFCFRPFALGPESPLSPEERQSKALQARDDCVEACRRGEILAIVYNDAQDAEKYVPKP